MAKDKPVTVSVLIPARNEEHFISECLESIFQNDFRAATEILLIDGVSSDRTVEIAAALCPPDGSLRVLKNEKGTIPAALNMGISEAGAHRDPHGCACSLFEDYIKGRFAYWRIGRR